LNWPMSPKSGVRERSSSRKRRIEATVALKLARFRVTSCQRHFRAYLRGGKAISSQTTPRRLRQTTATQVT
jgi:hypothetical protein